MTGNNFDTVKQIGSTRNRKDLKKFLKPHRENVLDSYGVFDVYYFTGDYFIDEYAPGTCYLSAAATLAKEGDVGGAEFLREFGKASPNFIAYGAVLGGKKQYAEELHLKCRASLDYMAMAAAEINDVDYAEELRQRKPIGASVDFIAYGAALAGNKIYAEKLRKEYKASAAMIALGAARKGDFAYAEELRVKHGVFIDIIAYGAAMGWHPTYLNALHGKNLFPVEVGKDKELDVKVNLEGKQPASLEAILCGAALVGNSLTDYFENEHEQNPLELFHWRSTVATSAAMGGHGKNLPWLLFNDYSCEGIFPRHHNIHEFLRNCITFGAAQGHLHAARNLRGFCDIASTRRRGTFYHRGWNKYESKRYNSYRYNTLYSEMEGNVTPENNIYDFAFAAAKTGDINYLQEVIKEYPKDPYLIDVIAAGAAQGGHTSCVEWLRQKYQITISTDALQLIKGCASIEEKQLLQFITLIKNRVLRAILFYPLVNSMPFKRKNNFYNFLTEYLREAKIISRFMDYGLDYEQAHAWHKHFENLYVWVLQADHQFNLKNDVNALLISQLTDLSVSKSRDLIVKVQAHFQKTRLDLQKDKLEKEFSWLTQRKLFDKKRYYQAKKDLEQLENRQEVEELLLKTQCYFLDNLAKNYYEHLKRELKFINPKNQGDVEKFQRKFDKLKQMREELYNPKNDLQTRINNFSDEFYKVGTQKILTDHRDSGGIRFLIGVAVVLTGVLPGLLILSVNSKYFSSKNCWSFWKSHGSCAVENISEHLERIQPHHKLVLTKG